jgi:hypothetical protein
MAKKSSKIYVLLACVGLIFCLLFLLFLIWARHPSKSNASDPKVEGATTGETSKSFETDYFITNLPDSFIVKTNSQNLPGDIIQQIFMTNNSNRLSNPNSDQLAITIGKIGGDGLDGIPAVHFRKLHPETYSESTMDSINYPNFVYTKTVGGYEKGIFFSSNGIYASVVASSTSDRKQQMDSIIGSAMASWEWK